MKKYSAVQASRILSAAAGKQLGAFEINLDRSSSHWCAEMAACCQKRPYPHGASMARIKAFDKTFKRGRVDVEKALQWLRENDLI